MATPHQSHPTAGLNTSWLIRRLYFQQPLLHLHLPLLRAHVITALYSSSAKPQLRWLSPLIYNHAMWRSKPVLCGHSAPLWPFSSTLVLMRGLQHKLLHMHAAVRRRPPPLPSLPWLPPSTRLSDSVHDSAHTFCIAVRTCRSPRTMYHAHWVLRSVHWGKERAARSQIIIRSM